MFNILGSKGINPTAVYKSSTEGVWQAEEYGDAKRLKARYEAAGLIVVRAEQDWMGDSPYTLIRFRLPPVEKTDFQVGDIVTVRGSDVHGEVIEVGSVGWKDGKVCVRRPMADGGRMTHWVKADKVRLAHSQPDAGDERDSMAESR